MTNLKTNLKTNLTVKTQTELINLNSRQMEIICLIEKIQKNIITRELAIRPLRAEIKKLRVEYKTNEFTRFNIDGSEVKLITPKVLRKQTKKPIKSKMEIIRMGKDLLKTAPTEIQAELLRMLKGGN